MTQTAVNMIDARGLGKRVATTAGHLDILSGIDLQIKRGETLAIVGVSGSGKSTLLGLLAGLDLSTAGEVFLDGQRLNDLDEDGRARVRARLVGFVFQSFQLLPSLTALENVMLPLELAGASDPRGQAAELLARVGLQARLEHYPKQLSGGEQQRVAIARAIAKRPEILLCDEPTGALDSKTGILVMEAIERVNRELGTSTAVITHNTVIGSMADLSAASYEDVVSFFQKWYGPANASVVIAGDVDAKEVQALAEKWFGEIPRSEPVAPLAPRPVVLTEEKRVVFEDRVQLPRVYLAWPTPAAYSPPSAALDALASLLADGKNSRLYKRLVYDLQVAQDVSAIQDSGAVASIFLVIITARSGPSRRCHRASKTLAERKQGPTSRGSGAFA